MSRVTIIAAALMLAAAPAFACDLYDLAGIEFGGDRTGPRGVDRQRPRHGNRAHLPRHGNRGLGVGAGVVSARLHAAPAWHRRCYGRVHGNDLLVAPGSRAQTAARLARRRRRSTGPSCG